MKMGTKILIGIAIGVVLIVAVTMIIFVSSVNKNNSTLSPNEKIISSQGNKKALILYKPSNSGGNVELTENIAKKLNKKGYEVTINYPSSEINYNLNDYDLIVYGSGVYVGQISKSLEEYAVKNPVENKEILVYITGMQLENLDEVTNFKNKLGNNKIHTIKLRKDETDKMNNFIDDNIK